MGCEGASGQDPRLSTPRPFKNARRRRRNPLHQERKAPIAREFHLRRCVRFSIIGYDLKSYQWSSPCRQLEAQTGEVSRG